MFGEALAEALERLGPTFIKMGQILAARQDVLPAPLVAPLRRLYEDLPEVPPGTLDQVFRSELGLDPDIAFSKWDNRPIASASVASVYRAWMRDGTAVAVKVLRPAITRIVAADLRLLQRAAGFLGRMPGGRFIPLEPMVEEVGAGLRRQLDLRLEAEANRRLRRALAPETGIVVPTLVDRYCSTSILTMALVEGEPPDLRSGTALHAEALSTVLRALYRMIFLEGLVHCDLHPGNLRVLPDGRVALLDFGFMADMSTTDRLNFARFFYAMATGDGPACARIAVETAAALRPGLDYPVFEREMGAIVERLAGATAHHFQVAGFVARLFDLMRRHGIRGTTAFTMAIVALVVLEGLAKEAEIDLDFQAEARPYLLRASLWAAATERAPSGVKEAMQLAANRRQRRDTVG